jgi:hypothetical protein
MPEQDYLKFNGLAEMRVVGKPTSAESSGHSSMRIECALEACDESYTKFDGAEASGESDAQ